MINNARISPRAEIRLHGTASRVLLAMAVILLALALPAGTAHALTTLEKTLSSGWHLVSIPLEPADASPAAVFSRVPEPLDLCGYYNGGMVPWDEASFPAIQPGNAYWLLLKHKCTLQVSGWMLKGATQAVAIHRGWNLIGTPWAMPTDWADGSVSFSDGDRTLTLTEAVAEEWFDGALLDYNSSADDYAALPIDNATPAKMLPWKGYLLHSNIEGSLLFAPVKHDNRPPVVEIVSPAEGAELRSVAGLIGTASDTDLVQYSLAWAEADSGEFVTFAVGGTSVVDATLGLLDPTLLMNGLYRVRLSAADLAGNTITTAVDVNVSGDQKPGLFTLSFVDLQVPVPGMTLQVARTYDSRDKRQGDFGIGWSSSFSEARIIENGVLGADWQGVHYGGGMGKYCIEGTRRHLVTVNLGEGEIQRFECVPAQECQSYTPPEAARLITRAMPGSTGRLTPLGDNDLLVLGSFPGPLELVNYSTLNPYNPEEYEYTTREGAILLIDKNIGLRKVINPDGGILTIERNGITHSSGRSIAFQRDPQGRITGIQDPQGSLLQYSYDSRGDLTAFTDAAGNTTRYFYGANHLLTDIRDPLNRPMVRNEYDDDGRLIASIDAKGNRTEFSNDVKGQEQIVRNPDGGMMRMIYDDNGNITQEERTVTIDDATVAIARITRELDADGNILSETDADGLSSVNEYMNGQNTRVVTDPGGLNLVTENVFDAAGQIVSITGPDGQVTGFGYAGGSCCRDKIASITDAAGHSTRMEYDAEGRLSRKIDPLGNSTLLTYDPPGNVASEELYDATGTLLSREAFTWDSSGRKLSESRHRTINGKFQPLTTFYRYDASGNIIAATDPMGRVTRSFYDAGNQLTAQVDVQGNTTTYEYDLTGENTRITYHDGTFEAYEYDANHNKISETDRMGHITRFEYDELDRLVRTHYADGSSRKTVYTAGGRTTAEIDEKGNRTDYEYDSAGRLTQVLQPAIFDASRGMDLRPVQRHEYDAGGRRTALTDANGRRTEFAYDSLGRLAMTRYPDGTVSERRYDALSRPVELIDEEGRSRINQYNAPGQLIRVVLPSPGAGQPRPVTAYTYDEAGLLLTETDANGNTTVNEYDRAGQPVRKRLPLGMVEKLTVDAAGNPVSVTDCNGQVTVYQYAGLGGEVIRKRADGSEVRVRLNANGKITEIADASGTVRYTYDTQDFLTGVQNPDGTFLRYRYDIAGNRIAMEVPSGTTAYEYDALRRLVKVTDPGGAITHYGYDAVGNRVKTTLPNGTVTEYTYNNRNRLTRLVNRNSAGQVLSSFDYTLSPSGNRTRVVEHSGRTVDYKYDGLDRLVEEKILDSALGNKTIQYTYDAVGNRLSRIENGLETHYTYDANNRLITESKTVSVGYFRSRGGLGGIGILSPNWWQSLLGVRSLLLALGVLYLIALICFARQVAASPAREPVWLIFNPVAARLISLLLVPFVLLLPDLALAARAESEMAEAARNLSTTITYEYDDNGNLISQTDGTRTNTFTYDPDNRLIEADMEFGGMPGQVRYSYSPDGNRREIVKNGMRTRLLVDAAAPLARVVEERCGASLVSYIHGEDLISMKRPAGTNYYLYDGQMSTRQLSAPDETITDAYVYDAFGSVLARTGSTPNDFLYTGEQHDPNSGFMYLRARYYDPATGRFITRDVWNGRTQDPISLHKYLYCGSNPVNRWDPSGLSFCSLMEVMVSFVIRSIMNAINFVNKVQAWCRANAWISMASYVLFFSQIIITLMAMSPLAGVGWQFTIKKRGPGPSWSIRELVGRYSVKIPSKKGDPITSNFRLEITLNNGTKAGFVLDFGDIYQSRIYGGRNLTLVQVFVCLKEVLKIELAFRANIPIVAAGGYIFGRPPTKPGFWSDWKWISVSFSWTILGHLKLGFPIVSWRPNGWQWFNGEFESETS